MCSSDLSDARLDCDAQSRLQTRGRTPLGAPPRRRTNMSPIEVILQELEQEAQTTRRVLERVPDDRLGWKPHDKSMSLGQLALHIAVLPGTIAELSQMSPFPVPKFEQ